MRERPIVFSSPMVRAILDGHKSQTRRVVSGSALEFLQQSLPADITSASNKFSPYGQPDDRLWVKEA